MDSDNRIIAFYDKNHEYHHGYIGYAHNFEEKLKEIVGKDDAYIERIRKASENYTKEKFDEDGIIGFILPQDFANVHTMTSGAIIIFNDKNGVIDIDDSYYTAFKHALEDAPCKESYVGGHWANADFFFDYVVTGNMSRAKLNREGDDWIYGFKAKNLAC